LIENVAIAGVGLIGGSFGLALRAAGYRGTITGVSSEATIRSALAVGAIDSALTLPQAAAEADLIFLAQPIGRIMDTLRHLDPLVDPDALVTDAGSTKHAIVTTAQNALHRCHFLGGHPLAGKEKRGVEAADAQLFQGRPWVLTPSNPDALKTDIAAEFIDWLHKIGARPVILGAEEHDRLISFSSHVPQLASTALAACIAELSPESAQVSGPGLVDSTRLALSPYDVWRDILATNSAAIEEALTAYIGKLEYLRENLRTRDLQREFETAAQFATRLREFSH
jgi:prephenate dehydrogenase